MAELVRIPGGHEILLSGVAVARIPAPENAQDTFTPIEEGVWKWHRRTETPVDHMRMELILCGVPSFTMIPAVSYNGNGWGSTPEYVGDRAEDGTPWTISAHRATIPGCTYSENERVSLALMARPEDEAACSLYRTEEGERHALIFPEEEKPRSLHRHFWGEPYEGVMEPRQDFEAIVMAYPGDGAAHRYKRLLDFAWRYFGHAVRPQRDAGQLYRLSLAYARYLLQREKDGFVGFTNGAQWLPSLHSYQKLTHRYEIGWVGQNASLAAAFLYDALHGGDKNNLQTGMEVLDAWLRHAAPGQKFISARVNYPYPRPVFERPLDQMAKEDIDPWDYGEAELEGILEGAGKPRRAKAAPAAHDACNLGTAAQVYFAAYDMLRERGTDKPAYLKAAMDTCDFALQSQDENGAFAKSWDAEGNVLAKDGTVGCFLVMPILCAYRRTGEEKYLSSAVRAFDWYCRGLEKDGFTTAGALDTYSIDKESASPLLQSAIALYEITGEKKYLERAEETAWYLCTWTLHYTISYPEDCVIRQLHYDTFGGTSVSTPHHALDQMALRDIPSFLKLCEYTGSAQWRERALAFWCNATQGVSDGTLVVNGRLRPAGSQDEAIAHTRWRRNSTPAFCPTQWLAAWPCALRLEILRTFRDWTQLNEGLTEIEGKLQ